MDCTEAKLQIEPYVAGELEAGLKETLEAHLAGCAECRLDSELTRASRNAPVDPPAIAEPAEADPPAPPAGGGRDWTIDSIFGSGGQGGAGSSDKGGGQEPARADRPAPASDSTTASSDPPALALSALSDGLSSGAPLESSSMEEPASHASAAFSDSFQDSTDVEEPDLPTALNGPAAPVASDEPPASDAPSWDFEPADTKGDAKPPEGSLFFAEKALSRSGTGARAKSSMKRVLMWGAGSLAGLALLGVSIWIAMTLRQPLPPSNLAERRAIRAGSGPESPVPGSVAQTPDAPPANTPGTNGLETAPPSTAPGTGTAGTGSSEAPASPEPPSAETSAAPTPSPGPPPQPAAPTPAPRIASTSPRTFAGEPTHPRATRSTVRKPSSQPLATATRPSATSGSRTVAVAKPPASTKTLASSTATRVPTGEAAGEPTPRESAAARPSTPPTVVAPEGGTPATHAPPATATTPPATESAAGASAGTAPAPPGEPQPSTAGSSSASQAAPSTPNPDRPIDRLHLATLNAEQNADLAALRKLRDAWRGFVRTSIGPDRARAKRELADCLWAVQTLTSKPSDQKEALAAYRDFVLNAPAGGADARTVARMRQLEDAVADRR